MERSLLIFALLIRCLHVLQEAILKQAQKVERKIMQELAVSQNENRQ